MKKTFIILITSCICISFLPGKIIAQQTIPSTTEQQLENLTDVDQVETEDDSWIQQMTNFRKNPLDLNMADYDDLRELKILTDLQVSNFLSYRKLLGKFISIYELQSIPAWDIVTIKKLLPYIKIGNSLSTTDDLMKRFRKGEHSFLFRISQVLEKSVGYTPKTTGSYYLGSPQKLFFRYRYQYKNLLQYGLAGDKDAGEQFFSGKQKYGFDFYSFHLFLRKRGIIQSLAIGDFTVNLGQGLIQWQSLAFGKGADISGIKRQSQILRPYNSAGEYNFHRGAGITIRKGAIEATAFASVRKISANFVADTVDTEDYFSSFLTSGYNRTQSELDDRNNLRQLAFGGNISFTKNRFHMGINGISYNFSLPIQKRAEPYNLFAISGRNWNNFSIDYSYTFRNLHVFGEAAMDKNYNKAIVSGMIISVDPKIDLSFLYRSISKKYQSINGNAFTENTYPTNENGFYAGGTIRPVQSIRLDIYADIYKFPWLKYLVDAPSYGKDFFAQLTYTPNKQVEIYSRYRNESKQANAADNTTVLNYLALIPKQNWRTQISYQLNREVTIRNRFELIWYNKKEKNNENGFLGFTDIIYNPSLKRYSGSLRLQYFETGGYNSRLYAYENDLLYSYSIPSFFDKGFRYYINVSYDLNKHFSMWLKWSQTIFSNPSIGSGLDEIPGNKRSEAKFQVITYF
ncbi:MAG: helix-hairpin-helix domain-containing protein [Bacteroidota bacterium]